MRCMIRRAVQTRSEGLTPIVGIDYARGNEAIASLET